MGTVSIKLTSAWPTDRGLRRPLEGPIEFPIAEAIRIVDAGCGEAADKVGAKLIARAVRAAAKEAAEKEAAEKEAAEKAAAEQEAADKAEADKLAATDLQT